MIRMIPVKRIFRKINVLDPDSLNPDPDNCCGIHIQFVSGRGSRQRFFIKNFRKFAIEKIFCSKILIYDFINPYKGAFRLQEKHPFF
jgi:hypothetical protein